MIARPRAMASAVGVVAGAGMAAPAAGVDDDVWGPAGRPHAATAIDSRHTATRTCRPRRANVVGGS